MEKFAVKKRSFAVKKRSFAVKKRSFRRSFQFSSQQIFPLTLLMLLLGVKLVSWSLLTYGAQDYLCAQTYQEVLGFGYLIF